MAEYSATITNTAYPGSPNQTATAEGPLTIAHLGNESDPDVLVSFDGTTTEYRVYGGGRLSPSRRDLPKTVYLKLESAGTVRVVMNRERWDGFHG